MGKKSTVRYVNHCLNLLSDDGVEGNRKIVKVSRKWHKEINEKDNTNGFTTVYFYF